MTGQSNTDWWEELQRDERELSTIRHDILVALIAAADDELLDLVTERLLAASELFEPAAWELARLRAVTREGRDVAS